MKKLLIATKVVLVKMILGALFIMLSLFVSTVCMVFMKHVILLFTENIWVLLVSLLCAGMFGLIFPGMLILELSEQINPLKLWNEGTI